MAARLMLDTKGIQVSVRAATAAGVACGLAQLLHLEHPIYAFIAAVIGTDLSPAQSRELGLRRLGATVVGASWGALLSHFLQPSAWALTIGVVVAMLTCHVMPLKEGAKVAGYTCGIVLLDHGAEAWGYAFFRLVETALGVGVAVLVSMVPKLLHGGEREHS